MATKTTKPTATPKKDTAAPAKKAPAAKAVEAKKVEAKPAAKEAPKTQAKAVVVSAPKKEATKTAAKAAEAKKVEAKPAAKPVEAKEEKKPATSGKTVYHVSKRENDGREWKVFIQGSTKVIKLFNTQKEALDYAKNLCKNKNDDSYVVLHGLDGKIRKY